jgi:uncharacterized protein (TIGR02246 family)
MYHAIPAVIGLLLFVAQPGFTQTTTDTEAIKAVVYAETAAWQARDFDALQATWLHDSTATRIEIASNHYNPQTGFDQIAKVLQGYIKAAPTPSTSKFTHENFIIQASADVAAVQYDQVTIPMGAEPRRSRQHRVLVKRDGRWRIASLVTISTESFGTGPQALEDSLNGAGYVYLQKGEVNKAIDVFKLNVQFYPASWNVYDSLGEAYLTAGDKIHAIENYEKSLQLNPKNDSARQALAKLR